MSNSYSRTAVSLHWVIAILIIVMLAGGFLMGNIPRESISLRAFAMNWHKTIGFLILALSLVRLFWRIGHKPPAPLPGLKTWEKMVAKIIHAVFYVFMIGMPLIGWAIISTSRFPSFFFNWTKVRIPELPFWAGLDKEPKHKMHELFEETHEVLAFIAIALILLHILAALKHHKAGKAILVRMIPSYKRKGI